MKTNVKTYNSDIRTKEITITIESFEEECAFIFLARHLEMTLNPKRADGSCECQIINALNDCVKELEK